MKKKEIKLTRGRLAEKRACKLGIKAFERWYPNGRVPLSEVFRKLQELANIDFECENFVDYAAWLIRRFPPTQEPLVLNELTEKVIIHNGDVTINCDIDGDYVIIVNGDLNIKGNVKLTGGAEIYAKNVIAQTKTIELDDFAGISAEETIDAQNIAAKGNAEIWAETVDTINIAAKGRAEIWAHEINVQNIMDDDGTRIRGEINIIQPSSNPQNTSTAS